ncbi:MAG: hypothetical protein Q4D65_07980 [Peptostreptococcaceae bacterium]|nr:hypothetical protein [Peptostreptococcaceae bacterium]
MSTAYWGRHSMTPKDVVKNYGLGEARKICRSLSQRILDKSE